MPSALFMQHTDSITGVYISQGTLRGNPRRHQEPAGRSQLWGPIRLDANAHKAQVCFCGLLCVKPIRARFFAEGRLIA